MRNVRRLAYGLGALPLVFAVASASAPVALAQPAVRYLDPVFTSVNVDRDLTYGKVTHQDGTAEKLKLDLYRPYGDTAGNRPVLIFVHGGDWTIDKGLKRNREVPRGFALRGFVAASINYRKGTSGATQAAQYDTRAAVRWFRAHAARYRIDPNHIILMGSSAGAINVLNVSFHPEDPGNSGWPAYSSAVAAAISVGGTDTEEQNIGPGESPIAMVHAADDHTVPIETAQATCEYTKAFGNVCEFFRYETGGHPPGFLIQNREQITEQASGFICRNVLGGCS